LFQVHWGLNFTRYLAGRYAEALQPAQRLLELASRDDDGSEQIEAHHAMWGILCLRGQPLEARMHLEHVSVLYDPERHAYLRYRYAGHDPGACCSTWSALSNWLIGFPERAQRELAACRARIDELQHPQTNILLAIAGWVHYRLGEFEEAARLGAEFVECARKHGFQALAEPAIVLIELARQTPSTPVQLRELNEHLTHAKSSRAHKLLMCSIMVEHCIATGDVELAEAVLTPPLATREPMLRAELLRLEGALQLQSATADFAAAERRFHSAIEVALAQGAKSFELRAATSLATLWHQQGKRNEAQELLGGVYAWFTEGFQTPDLQRAKSLLDEWAPA
jgi:tetratricopeptide (TPR) repeat protein